MRRLVFAGSLLILVQPLFAGLGEDGNAKTKTSESSKPAVRRSKRPAEAAEKRAPLPRTLEGTWKGTFVRDGVHSAEYTVKVSPEYRVQLIVAVALAGSGNGVIEGHPDSNGEVVGTLSDGLLTWQSSSSEPGVAPVAAAGQPAVAAAQPVLPAREVTKLCSLRLDPDGQHATLEFKVTVVTRSGTHTNREEFTGTGRMARAR